MAQQILDLSQNIPSYSFEFIDRNSNTPITELFISIPPDQYTMQYGYRINVVKLADGALIDDWGNDFKRLKVTWDVHFYWNVPYGEQFDVRNGNNPYQVMFGLDEFFRMRYMFAEGRDKSLLTNAENNKTKHYLINTEFQTAKDRINFVAVGVLSKLYDRKLNYSNTKLVYHDWYDKIHEEVIIQDSSFRRTKDDVNSFVFELDLLCIKPYYGKKAKQTARQNLYAAMDSVMGYSITSRINPDRSLTQQNQKNCSVCSLQSNCPYKGSR